MKVQGLRAKVQSCKHSPVECSNSEFNLGGFKFSVNMLLDRVCLGSQLDRTERIAKTSSMWVSYCCTCLELRVNRKHQLGCGPFPSTIHVHVDTKSKLRITQSFAGDINSHLST